MRRLLIILAVFISSLPVVAQKQKGVGSIHIPVSINWAKGETSYLTITEHEETVAEDEYKKILVTSDVRLRVLEKTDTSYTIEWTYTGVDAVIEDYQLRGAILRMGQQEEIRSLIQKMIEGEEESAKGMRVVYTTDQYGTFRDIVNRTELREQYKNSFNAMLGVITQSMPEAQRDSVATLFQFVADLLIADPDFGLNFTDIQLLHQGYGYEYEVGKGISEEGVWPSPFNDNNYPVTLKLKMSAYDSKTKKCHIEGSNEIGVEAMNMFIADLAEIMTAMGVEEDLSDISYEIKSEYQMNIDLVSGWIYDAEMTSRRKENHDINTTTLKIKLRL